MTPARKRALLLFYDRYFTKSQFVKECVAKRIFKTRQSAYDALAEFVENEYVSSSCLYGKDCLTITDKGRLYVEIMKEVMS